MSVTVLLGVGALVALAVFAALFVATLLYPSTDQLSDTTDSDDDTIEAELSRHGVRI